MQLKLTSLPDGKLICARNHNRYKWYLSDGHTSTYLPKAKRHIAEQLAARKYFSALLEDLQEEQLALDFYLRHHPAHSKAEQLLTQTPEYRSLLSSYFTPKDKELADWASAPYNRNPKYPEQCIHKSVSGHLLRSKSEVFIDMALFTNNIPFRYECALELGLSTLYPDFTIRHPRTGELFFWEHFGLMDDPSYRKNVGSKLQIYTTHGIIPSINLITTYETHDHPLDISTIHHIIEEYFL